MRACFLAATALLILFAACSRQDGGTSVDLDAQQLLDRSEKTMLALTNMHYTMIYSLCPAGSADTTNSIYDVLLEPLAGNAFGYKLFAQSMSGYHAVYDGSTALLGMADSSMATYTSEQDPVKELLRSFAGNTRITHIHGKTLFEGVRGSDNIEAMAVQEIDWRGGSAYKLSITFGERPPMMGGTLEILFRKRDYFPVRVSEALRIQDGEQDQTQFYAAELTGIELNIPIAAGQFTSAALSGGTHSEQAPHSAETAPTVD